MEPIKVGDTVRCLVPGSWVDGKEFTVKQLNVRSSDGIVGHFLSGWGGTTVVPEFQLTRVDNNKECERAL